MDEDDPNINKVIFSDYLITKKIGKGSFGTVYSGIIISTNQKVAFKLEKRNGDCPGLLEIEACRLYLLQGEGIPKIICYGNNLKYNILIQELLGNSLENIFNNFGKKFSLKTVCNIGIQIIKRIKHVHKRYHLHRDIKPDNFMTGHYKSDNKIYLIDFGLAKKYYSSTKKRHIKFQSGKNLVGTARYCSRNAHKGFELSRRDDIESIGYCLIYFLKGILPWQGLKVKRIEDQFKKIAEKKYQTSFEELTKDIPEEFLQYFKHCEKLRFEDEPNYDYLIALFKNALSKYCNDNGPLYDWKKQENGKNNTAILKMIYSNSRNISMLVNENSNNLSVVDSKGEEKENKAEVINDNNNKNDISNIILSKEIFNDEKENKNPNEVNNNNQKNDEVNNKENIKEEKKDDNNNTNNNNNELKKEQDNIFLPPKKLDDFFSEGDFKSEEMSFKDFTEKETNHFNVCINNNIIKENNIKITKEETEMEPKPKKEDNEIVKEKNKNNKIINNFNINISITKEDIKDNKINNQIKENINNKKEKDDKVYEYEIGIIDNKTRNRNKKIEGNITNDKINKKNNVICDCTIF